MFSTRGLAFAAACCAAALASGSADEDRLPDAQIDGIEVVKAWSKKWVRQGENNFSSTGRSRQPSPDSWAGTVVYQIVIDRFNNGDLSNDYLNLPQAGFLSQQLEKMARGDLSSLPDWRHGGDLKGIKDRLGYLQDLGVQALWITPVLMHDGQYHAYCLSDPTTLDPGFGTMQDFRDLVSDAHARGISVVLDIVTNHLCDPSGLTTYVGNVNHSTCASELYHEKYYAGKPGKNSSQMGMNFSAQWFPPFRTQEFFSRCGLNTVADTSGMLPTAVFGDFGQGMFDFNTLNKDFQEVYTNLHKYWLATLDLDGFRLDAVKHVTDDFVAYFSTEMRAYARTLGKDNFLIIGENAAEDERWKAAQLGKMMTDPRRPEAEPMMQLDAADNDYEPKHWVLPEVLIAELRIRKGTYLADASFPAPGMTSLYNFAQAGLSRAALRCEDKSSNVESYFTVSGKRKLLLAQAIPQPGAEPDAHLWTPLDLHDWPRFLGKQPSRADLLMPALAWQLTAPGAPVLLYGVEHAFNGNCVNGTLAVDDLASRKAIEATCASASDESYGVHQDSLKRQDMFMSGPWRLGSAIEEVNDLAQISNITPALSRSWEADPMLPRGHEVYLLTRKLIALRKSCPALAKGDIFWHAASDVPCGFLAFSRTMAIGDTGDVIVLINSGGGGPVSVNQLLLNNEMTWEDGQRYVNVFNTSQLAQVQRSDGNAVLAVQPSEIQEGTTMIFIREGSTVRFDDRLGIALCGSASAPVAAEDLGPRRLAAGSGAHNAPFRPLGVALVPAALIGAVAAMWAVNRNRRRSDYARIGQDPEENTEWA